MSTIAIRQAGPADALSLRLLAQLDSSPPLAEPALVAEIDGEIRVAASLDGSGVLADPFHRSADAVELLRIRVSQLREDPSHLARLLGWPRARRSAASRGASSPRSVAA